MYRTPEVANDLRGDPRESQLDELLRETPDPKAGNRPPDVIATEGGTTVLVESARDPYERLDDLMVVIEALCPRHPDREPFTGNLLSAVSDGEF